MLSYQRLQGTPVSTYVTDYISIEELRQTVVCIAAQRLVRTSSGTTSAVFEIVQDDVLDEMTDSIMKGDRIIVSEERKVEALMLKYSLPKAVPDGHA